MLLRRLKKSKSLRIVNLVGLSVIFSSLLLSSSYIRKELSYDRFHEKADRIVRFSLQYDNEPVDVRIWGFTPEHPALNGVSGIEQIVRMNLVNRGEMHYDGKIDILRNFYFASSNFFEAFDFTLLEGDRQSILDTPGKGVVSRSYARRMFGEESPIGRELTLAEGQNVTEQKIMVSGVFEDFPKNSHFHTDLIVHKPDTMNENLSYVYLVLHPGTTTAELQQTIAANLEQLSQNAQRKASPVLFPLTDIHLHSHFDREHEPNGHIQYIYLIGGANVLLLLVVLLNLWLNAGLIFSFNRRYYQLLRMNGASGWVVLRDEIGLAVLLAVAAMLLGTGLAGVISPGAGWEVFLQEGTLALLYAVFLLLVVAVSVIPVMARMPSTLFRNTQTSLREGGFNLSRVKYMLIGQYGMVMFIMIVSFCITKQIHMIRASQVGGEEQAILVMKEQPGSVMERYDLLKAELTKHPEIRMVTSAMQLPGSAIRDGIRAWKEGEGPEDARSVPILAVGNDFLPFFGIQPIAGRNFEPNPRSSQQEWELLSRFWEGHPSNVSEEYVLNQKAVQLLGFNSPEEAIGRRLYLEHGTVDYINNGTIVGVTENFNYTTTYQDSIPQLLLQRSLFQSCFMVYLSGDETEKAIGTFNRVWNEINPEYPADYTFLQNVYNDIYYNELNAERLVRIFSVLSLVVATLGLIIVMAFVVKRKTKEIGVRKVHGATSSDIIRMLNSRFVIWIGGAAFVLAVPGAYIVMRRWLENFAYKTSLDWWIFALAGASVLLLSIAAVSWQSWRAASLNPVKTLKTE